MTDTDSAAVTVRFFAGAARAMGTRSTQVEVDGPSTLAEVVEALDARGDAARVLGLCSWLVDARRATQDDVVAPGAVVDALPPFAGG